MSGFRQLCAFVLGTRRPTRHMSLRIDAYAELLVYHENQLLPKPPPQKTMLLPVRTRTSSGPMDVITLKQTHAYHEEIDTISAASLNKLSEFQRGHWYLIHPLYPQEAMTLGMRVLQELHLWIEHWPSDEIYVGTHRQVAEFRDKRKETLVQIKNELERRKDKRGGDGQEGYLGKGEKVHREVTRDFCESDREQDVPVGRKRREPQKAEVDALVQEMVKDAREWEDEQFEFVHKESVLE